MGMQTIAEFVEDRKTLQVLAAIGIDYAQGYGIAKPKPLEMLRSTTAVPVCEA
jgi:Amt family ammonium transporter